MENGRILHTMKIMQESFEKRVNANLKDMDITLSQARVLKFLSIQENSQAPLKFLEKHMGAAQSTTAGIVLRLEKKDFIKTITDDNDKRIKLVVLNDLGKECVLTVKNEIDDISNKLFLGFEEDERETLFHLVNKLIDNFHNNLE